MLLKEYWPRCLQELVEFDQIANAEQPEFERAVSDVKSAPDDFFLVSLTEYMGVSGGKRFWAFLWPLATLYRNAVKES